MKFTLAILTLNEIECIPVILPQIKKEWVDEIIVVDGGSTDGTVEWCKKHNWQVLRQKTKGYGAGMQELIAIAKGDVIIEFMPDGNCKVETLPKLIQKISEGYDLVIASRYKDGAKSYDDTWLTRLGNWGFTTLINVLFGTSFTDAMMGYRAYRKDRFYTMEIDAKGLTFPTQGSIQFAKYGYKIAEIGSDEPMRIGGTRKCHNIKTGWELLTMIMRELVRDKNKAL